MQPSGKRGGEAFIKLLSKQIQKEKIHLRNILNEGWFGFGGYSMKLCLESGDSCEPREEQEVEELGRGFEFRYRECNCFIVIII